MGYGYYVLPDGREAGYGVEAECDVPGCAVKIDRGLGYLCGRSPDGHRDSDEYGCGRYFCGEHMGRHDCPNPQCWVYDEDDNPVWCERGTGAADQEACEEHRRLHVVT